MKKNEIIKLLPLIILVSATVFMLVTVMLTTASLMKEHIVGLVMLGIVLVFRFLIKKLAIRPLAECCFLDFLRLRLLHQSFLLFL